MNRQLSSSLNNTVVTIQYVQNTCMLFYSNELTDNAWGQWVVLSGTSAHKHQLSATT